MLINAFRKELKILLSGPGLIRTPVIRRSLLDNWLYATDLPALCRETDKSRFLDTLAQYGWETMEAEGWIQMRKNSPEPPDNWYDGSFGQEAACCRSLLMRHPGRPETEAEKKVQCVLIKAAEEGEKAFESACADLHRSWAECLRKGEPLPAVHPAYFSARKE